MTVKLQETFRLVLKKLLSHKKGSEEPNSILWCLILGKGPRCAWMKKFGLTLF